MLPGQFLHRLPAAARAHLPALDGAAHMQPRGRLFKVWFGAEAAIHYEIWMHERTLQMEIGLHCEATPELNEAIRRGSRSTCSISRPRSAPAWSWNSGTAAGRVCMRRCRCTRSTKRG